MTKTKDHTSLPWAETKNNGEPWVCSDTEQGGLVCPLPEAPGDAEFLLRACNCHYKLVAALRRLLASPILIGSRPEALAAYDECLNALNEADHGIAGNPE